MGAELGRKSTLLFLLLCLLNRIPIAKERLAYIRDLCVSVCVDQLNKSIWIFEIYVLEMILLSQVHSVNY